MKDCKIVDNQVFIRTWGTYRAGVRDQLYSPLNEFKENIDDLKSTVEKMENIFKEADQVQKFIDKNYDKN